jgi:hypothetical protein
MDGYEIGADVESQISLPHVTPSSTKSINKKKKSEFILSHVQISDIDSPLPKQESKSKEQRDIVESKILVKTRQTRPDKSF